MCKRYPGKRCGNPMHERVSSLINQVEEAKAFRDSLDREVVHGREITKASQTVTVLEGRLKDAERKYDVTDAGIAALEESIKDESLSRDELNALKVRLKDATKVRADREKIVSDSEARKNNVMYFLEQAGVPEAERAQFSDENIYLPAGGSAKHYQTIKENRETAYQTRLAEFNIAETKAKASGDPADKKKVEEAELALSNAKSAYNHALYVFDSTSQGISNLKAKVAKAAVCYTTQDVINRTKLERRLTNAEKAHRINLDSRNYRAAKLSGLKATVAAYGGDVKAAVEAFKNKNPLPKTPRKRVPVEQERTAKIFAHITERDLAVIDSRFKQSPEYKAGGHDARARFLERTIMTPPHELYSHESLAEADAKVTIASTGKTGRNNTIVDIEQGRGIGRDRKICIKLTARNADILRARGPLLKVTTSSQVRTSLLGGNPLAHENDRSAKVRAAKSANASNILMNQIKIT